MIGSSLSRRIATFVLAGALAAGAAVLAPKDAKALVTFGDGKMMSVEFACPQNGSISKTFFNGTGEYAYARTRIYSHSLGRWITDTGWIGTTNSFTMWGPVVWPYGHGWFTLRSWVGRYINGRFVSAQDVDYQCRF
jgi:hypothetical protein